MGIVLEWPNDGKRSEWLKRGKEEKECYRRH